MEDVIAMQAVIAPMVLLIVQGLKTTGIASKWAPALSMGIGVLFGTVYTLATQPGGVQTVFMGVLAGLMAGLAASGIYSGAKKTIGSLKKE